MESIYRAAGGLLATREKFGDRNRFVVQLVMIPRRLPGKGLRGGC